jgi:hypothetical protein
MYCEFPSNDQTSSAEGIQASTFASPYHAMAEGLHAMAQSLTVLRGALGACQMRCSEPDKLERYLAMATKQSETMNDLFSGLRATLDSTEGKANLEKVDIGELIRFAVREMDQDLRERGATISFIELDSPVQILGDVEKTDCAIRAALRFAISVSPRNGQLQMSVRPSNGFVEVIVETNRDKVQDLSFADRLNLSLIETNVRSQGGRHKYVEYPLALLFSLPAYRPELEAGALTAPCSRADFSACNSAA